MPLDLSLKMWTEKGPFRDKNEDAMGFLEQPGGIREGIRGVCLVADGLGGHEMGEIASTMAVDLFRKEFTRSTEGNASLNLNKVSIGDDLKDLVVNISEKIHQFGTTGESMHRDPFRAGMATTITAAVVVEDVVYVVHVGDSRAYLLRNGNLLQITEDDTLIAESVRSGKAAEKDLTNMDRNVITQALGLDMVINPHIYSVCLQGGDQVLLCSDGLHGYLSDQCILHLIDAYSGDPDMSSFVQQAIKCGSKDNITVLLLSFCGN